MSLKLKDKAHLSRLLCEAILKDDYSRCKTLLLSGADPNVVGISDASAIHLAAGVESRSEVFTALLLQHSADPNLRNSEGTTPVSIAASYGRCRTLKLLIEAGGDVNTCDCEGYSVLDFARQSMCPVCYGIILDNSFHTANEALSRSHSLCFSKSKVSESGLPSYLSSDQSSSASNGTSETSYLNTAFCCSLCDSGSDNHLVCGERISGDFPNFNRSGSNVPSFRSEKSYDRGQADFISAFDDFDLTSVSSLSTSSSCSEHQLRIERCVTLNEDDDSGFSLVSTHLIPDFASDEHVRNREHSVTCRSSECSYLNNTNLVLSDWQNDTGRSSFEESSNEESPDPATLREIRQLSDLQLRARLVEFGENPGPIVSSTRRMHELKLCGYIAGKIVQQDKSSEFPPELSALLQQRLDISSLAAMESEAVSLFDIPNPTKKWREGIQKCCFNYLLLDPRVTQNLPVRVKSIGMNAAFNTFIHAVFYIGKGKRSRPYEHFKEAIAHKAKDTQASSKVSQIQDVWNAGLGVISLHVFQNVIACEAYTREACMIQAIGLDRLTNKCHGQMYGPASTWNGKQVRQAGVVMLKKAFNILLHEGERQIRIEDMTTSLPS